MISLHQTKRRYFYFNTIHADIFIFIAVNKTHEYSCLFNSIFQRKIILGTYRPLPNYTLHIPVTTHKYVSVYVKCVFAFFLT